MWPIAEPPLAFVFKNVGGGFLNEGKETISPQRLKGDYEFTSSMPSSWLTATDSAECFL